MFDLWHAVPVAGGMSRGRRGLPMQERVGLGRSTDPCPGRHCWVTGGSGADPGHRRPGLLVEWRRAGEVWEGRVVYLSLTAPDRWVLVEEWLPAALLDPG